MCKCVQDIYKTDEFEELLESARMNAANDWEESFVSDMKDRLDQNGRRMYLSEMQKQTIERIASDG